MKSIINYILLFFFILSVFPGCSHTPKIVKEDEYLFDEPDIQAQAPEPAPDETKQLTKTTEKPAEKPADFFEQYWSKEPSADTDVLAMKKAEEPAPSAEGSSTEYTVGADDALQIQVIQPEQIAINTTVSPDGFISFPYIGNVEVKDKTLTHIQHEIEQRLSDGYMKYPIVAVTLQKSNSRKFYVYGEVNHPGAYPLEENITIIGAISMAGGFTKYGSSNRVKVLKPLEDKSGYETLKVNIAKAMEGNSKEDIGLNNGDIVVVSEGIF